MTLVSPAEVKQIIDTDLSDDIVNTFIESADALVSEVLGDDDTITDDHRKSIELWLSAHFIAATREQQIQKAGAGGADVVYQGVTGKGLESTYYGQQVLILDTTGKIAEIIRKNIISGKGGNAFLKAITSFTDR